MEIYLNEEHLFSWGDLYLVDFEINNSFDALLKLNSNQEKSLLESKEKLKKSIESIQKSYETLKNEEIGNYVNMTHFEDEMIIDELQKLQRYSLIMSIFSFYEARLKSLSNMIDKEFNFKIKQKDLNNSKGDLFKYWTYLVKIYELHSEPLQKLFESLNHHKRLRNLIAHHDGILNENQMKEMQTIKGISFSKSGDFYLLQIIEDVYIENLLKKIKFFFQILLGLIDERFLELKYNENKST